MVCNEATGREVWLSLQSLQKKTPAGGPRGALPARK
jgi:hypothetical protein